MKFLAPGAPTGAVSAALLSGELPFLSAVPVRRVVVFMPAAVWLDVLRYLA